MHAGDTVLHSWEVLANILSSDKIADILCDIGMYDDFSFCCADNDDASHTGR